jgi:hypothetical protein
VKTPRSRSGTTETPLENEDRRAGCRLESPKVWENQKSAPFLSIWRAPPTASPSLSSSSKFCTEAVSFFISFLFNALQVRVSFLVSIFRAVPMEGLIAFVFVRPKRAPRGGQLLAVAQKRKSCFG